MRTILAVVLLFALQTYGAQRDVWQDVRKNASASTTEANALSPAQITLSPAEEEAIARTLKARKKLDMWCDGAENDDWLESLSCSVLDITVGRDIRGPLNVIEIYPMKH